MNLSEAINKIINQFGKEIIFENRFISILDDFGAFRDSNSSRFILRTLISSGHLQELLLCNIDEQEIIIHRVSTMCGFDSKLVRNVISAFEPSLLVTTNSPTIVSSPRTKMKNQKTDIIFIIDSCAHAAKCGDSFKFFIEEITSELGNDVQYSVLHYNDISLWDFKSSIANQALQIPYIHFVGNNDFRQALRSLCDAPLKWKEQTSRPIMIWLVGSNPMSPFADLLESLSHQDILFNKAYRITVSFGNNASKSIISSFSNRKCYSSIDIDDVIDCIKSAIGLRLINVEAFLDDEDVFLLQKKIEEQSNLNLSPELLIKKKLESLKDGFYACQKNGKWGWMGINGTQVIPFQYETVMGFSEGLAAVSSKGTPKNQTYGLRFYTPAKWGFIDFLGRQVIEEIYDEVKSFSHGLAFVEQEGKWGAIDKNGKVIIPLEFGNISFVSESIIRVTKRNYSPNTNDFEEKVGYFTNGGNQISDCIYDFASYEFINNKGIVKLGNQTYIINERGRRLSKIPYFSVQFSDNKSLLLISRGWINRECLYGLCSYDGIEIVPPKYEKIITKNSIIFAKGKDFVDYYTENGVKVNDSNLISGFEFVDEYAIVRNSDGKWYRMDKAGRLFLLKYSEIYYVFENGNILTNHIDSKYSSLRFCALVEPDGTVIKKYHLFNNKLNPKFNESSEYIEFEEIETDSNKAGTKIYWFNKHNGVQIYSGNKYNESHNFRIRNGYIVISHYYKESLLPTFRNGSLSYSGEKIPAYTTFRLRDFNTGRWIGTVKTANDRSKITEFDGLGVMDENRMPVKRINNWGYIDCTGEIVIDTIYDNVEPFHNGLAIVSKNNLYGVIDIDGKSVVDMQYQHIKLIQKDIYGNV